MGRKGGGGPCSGGGLLLCEGVIGYVVDACWQCWSPVLLICLENLQTYFCWWNGRKTSHCVQRWGLRKHKMPAVHWWSHPTRLWRCSFKEEDACAGSVGLQLRANIATGGMVPPERCTPACKGEGPMQEAIKVSRSLVDRAVPPGYGGAPWWKHCTCRNLESNVHWTPHKALLVTIHAAHGSILHVVLKTMHTDPDSVLIIPLQWTQSFVVYLVNMCSPWLLHESLGSNAHALTKAVSSREHRAITSFI